MLTILGPEHESSLCMNNIQTPAPLSQTLILEHKRSRSSTHAVALKNTTTAIRTACHRLQTDTELVIVHHVGSESQIVTHVYCGIALAEHLGEPEPPMQVSQETAEGPKALPLQISHESLTWFRITIRCRFPDCPMHVCFMQSKVRSRGVSLFGTAQPHR